MFSLARLLSLILILAMPYLFWGCATTDEDSDTGAVATFSDSSEEIENVAEGVNSDEESDELDSSEGIVNDQASNDPKGSDEFGLESEDEEFSEEDSLNETSSQVAQSDQSKEALSSSNNNSRVEEFEEPSFSSLSDVESESNTPSSLSAEQSALPQENQQSLAPPPAVVEQEDMAVNTTNSNQELSPIPEVSEEASISDKYQGLDSSNIASKPMTEQKTSLPTGERVTITDLQYRASEAGGTFVIQADGPIPYDSRYDENLGQLVITMNAKAARSLQRPFNTKDMPGNISFIDVYSPKGSKKVRVVVQLRPGSANLPHIQPEDNALFIISQGEPSATQLAGNADGVPSSSAAESTVSVDNQEAMLVESASSSESSPLFSAASFEDFLRSNQNFTGKKISIETQDMDLKELFKLISEEAGVNVVLSDEVKGMMSVKLKNVPWDQALVQIMRAKKLGYTRSGNVLRIAPIADIRAEEDDAIKIQMAKKNNEPPIIKTLTVNYAPVVDLEKQIKPLLSTKGSVISDARTSSLVISDLPEYVERAEKFVTSVDIPPQQVLIEGRIVEASDAFEKRIGINWSFSGRSTNLGNNLRLTPGLSVTPGTPAASTLGINFSLGTLDILGDLTASLRLFELQGLVKVISSPRILTLHNETADITQTTEIPLITANILPSGAVNPIVNFKQVQLRLSVTPQITNNGNVILGVSMNREIPGDVVDQQTGARPINSRSAKTKVLLKNSQTAVIGGIYQNDMTEGQNKVPGLANIPLIGWLFKNKSVDQRRTELLIFLTPKILGQQGSLSQMVTNPSLSPSAPAPVEEDISAALDGTEANGDSSLSDSAQQDGGNKQESSGDDEFGLEEQSEDF